MRIDQLGPGDDARVADLAHLLDYDPRDDAIRRFLDEGTHHLLVAYEDDEPVGFVSGVELTHPDKGTEMLLYEVAVDEPHRRRGIGRAPVASLAALARERGCYGMFVLTEHDNDAAIATYSDGRSVRADSIVMFTWEPPA